MGKPDPRVTRSKPHRQPLQRMTRPFNHRLPHAHNTLGRRKVEKRPRGIFLNISSGFPNAIITYVVHNMCQCQISIEYTQWVTRRMAGCKTIFTFDDNESEPFEVSNGLDQEDPLSSVLYGFYNADLIEHNSDPNGLKSAFVDDTMFFVAGNTYQENNTKLANMMTQRNSATEWSKLHNSNFEIDKFALLHLSC